MLETERKLHILTPLLCLVLLMLGSTPSGLSEGPLGRVWPSLTTSGLYCLQLYWQLHRGFRRTPSVGCGLPYHIWSPLSGILLTTASGVSELPLGRVWPSLQHLVSNPLGVCWQLLWGFSECPLGRVWPSLPHLVSSVWNSTGNCSGTKTQLS